MKPKHSLRKLMALLLMTSLLPAAASATQAALKALAEARGYKAGDALQK